MNKDALYQMFAESGLVFVRATSQDTPVFAESEWCEEQFLKQE